MPNRERVRSERRAENPGIRKEEEELRLDSWLRIRSTTLRRLLIGAVAAVFVKLYLLRHLVCFVGCIVYK